MKKRADGRYCKQIVVGYKPDGRRITKNIYGKTIKEIERKERDIRNTLQLGIDLQQEDITVEEWGREWLKVYKSKCSDGTYSMYESCLRNHIIPTIGHLPLTKLKPIQIQKSLNDILDVGHTRTAEIYKLTIKQIVNQAVEEGIIVKSMCNGLDKIKPDAEEKRVLTDFEMKCMARTKYSERERLFLNLLYYTGARRGETLALTINDINRQKRTITINKSLDIRENTPVIKEPKTKAGYREIPIPNILFEELTHYISKHKSIYLFTMKDGKPLSRSSFEKCGRAS